MDAILNPPIDTPWVATTGINVERGRIDQSRYNFGRSFPPASRDRTHMPDTSLTAALTPATIVSKDGTVI